MASRAASRSTGIGSATDLTPKIQALLGLLLAGFVAALNFIGLKSQELTDVLRNEGYAPTVVAFLLFVGLIAALLSLLIKASEICQLRILIAAGTLVAACLSLVIYLIPVATDNRPTGDARNLPLGVGVLLIVVSIVVLSGWRKKAGGRAEQLILVSTVALSAVVFIVGTLSDTSGLVLAGGLVPIGASVAHLLYSQLRVREDSTKAPTTTPSLRLPVTANGRRGFSIRNLLLILSLVSIGLAVLSAQRLEAASQDISTFPQIETELDVAALLPVLKIHVSDAKLSLNEEVVTDVYAVPNNTTAEQICALSHDSDSACPKAPCLDGYTFCRFIYETTLPPNTDGTVDTHLSVPFSSTKLSEIEVQARLFQRNVKNAPGFVKNSPEYESLGKKTVADMVLPEILPSPVSNSSH